MYRWNDQVRFEVTARSLAPNMGVIAPLREWDMLTREDEIDYALERGIDIPITKAKPYSIDQNIWGCAIGVRWRIYGTSHLKMLGL